jgi:hypothetical protein
MESVTEALREALEKSKKKDSPRLAGIKKCSSTAKARLYKVKRIELRSYYAEECAKSGVFIGKSGFRPPAGQPKGKDRTRIAANAYAVAQSRTRKTFYDLYLEFYHEELEKAGIEQDTGRWERTQLINKLQADVERLENLLATCKCRG